MKEESKTTHGSPELDADAAYLESMGADAGPTMIDKNLQDRTDLRRIRTILNTSQVISRGGKFVAIEMKEANEMAALIERILT